MAIKFTKVETKAYPLIEKITEGMVVIGLKDSDYGGLEGTISEIKYGTDKETENETILDIYIDFEEHEYASIETTHPHLNGTGIGQVICGEDELGFNFDDSSPFYVTADGKVVCPHCYEAMDRVNETQHDDITWTFQNGEYVKENADGSSDGKKCDVCDGFIEDADEEVFRY